MIKFSKGYRDDAGVDIILDQDVVFPPGEITAFNLGIGITPKRNTMAVIAPRSSFAKKGLIICNCPIDANYQGDIHAIVYNGSDMPVECKKDHAFCQIMMIKIRTIRNVEIRKKGKRKTGNFGSTDS